MGIYFEAGVGKATAGSSLEMGRSAAMEAISQLEKFKPVLTLVFVCSELDMSAVNQGVTQILGDCPIVGTTTAGEIANGAIKCGVVTNVIASPHLSVHVGMRGGVSKDYRKPPFQNEDGLRGGFLFQGWRAIQPLQERGE
jgi:hypothetical protein